MSHARKSIPELQSKVARLTEQGYSGDEIASRLNVSTRTVYRHRSEYRKDGKARVFIVPNPRRAEDLPLEMQEFVEPTPDAFELFFNRYSGKTLAPHSKVFVTSALGQEQVLINVPPRHAKSTIFSVWLPIWLIA